MEEKHHQCEKREARARKRTARTIATKQSSKRLRKKATSDVRACDLTRARASVPPVPPVPPVPRSAEFDLCSYCVLHDYCAVRRNASVIDAPLDDFAEVMIELYCYVS